MTIGLTVITLRFGCSRRLYDSTIMVPFDHAPEDVPLVYGVRKGLGKRKTESQRRKESAYPVSSKLCLCSLSRTVYVIDCIKGDQSRSDDHCPVAKRSR